MPKEVGEGMYHKSLSHIAIDELLQSVDLGFKHQSNQIVTACPQCGRNGHLYIDAEKEVFYCQKCGYGKGLHLDHLKRKLMNGKNDKPTIAPAFPKIQQKTKPPTTEYLQQCHHRLLDPAGAVPAEWLTKVRGFSVEAIHHFYLGFERLFDRDWIVIPYTKKGKPVNVKYRSVPTRKQMEDGTIEWDDSNKSFRRWAGGESILFNHDCMAQIKDGVAFMVEGEFDVITMWDQGYNNVVGTTVGAKGSKTEWADYLDPFTDIYLIYDTDTPGQDGARELARRFGENRCYKVLLPDGVKDINDFFSKHHRSLPEFEEIIELSEKYEVENIYDLRAAFDDIETQAEEDLSDQPQSMWPSIRKFAKAYRKGNLIIVTGTAKTGKTSLCLLEALHQAKRGIPALMYCLEMRPSALAMKLLQAELKMTEKEVFDNINARHEAMVNLQPLNLYFGYSSKRHDRKATFDTIRRAFRRYGFGFIVFDGIHSLVRSTRDQSAEISLVSAEFKDLAEELHVPIMLIAHPRKLNEDRMLGGEDMKDSVSLLNDCDLLMALWRKKIKFSEAEEGALASHENRLWVRFEASRFDNGGLTSLKFVGEHSLIEEFSEEEHNQFRTQAGGTSAHNADGDFVHETEEGAVQSRPNLRNRIDRAA